MRYISPVSDEKVVTTAEKENPKIAHTRAPNLGKVGEGVVECSFRNYNVLGSEG